MRQNPEPDPLLALLVGLAWHVHVLSNPEIVTPLYHVPGLGEFAKDPSREERFVTGTACRAPTRPRRFWKPPGSPPRAGPGRGEVAPRRRHPRCQETPPPPNAGHPRGDRRASV